MIFVESGRIDEIPERFVCDLRNYKIYVTQYIYIYIYPAVNTNITYIYTYIIIIVMCTHGRFVD